MKRTMGRLVAALLVAVSTFAVNASAPTPTSANFYSCQDIYPPVNYHTGWTSWGGNFHGVRAYFDVYGSSAFGPCTEGTGNDGAMGYVAMEPHTITQNGQILQIGLIRCNASNCDPTKYRFWVAEGGCNGDAPTVTFVGNPQTSTVAHKYWIDRGTGGSAGWWYAYVDSTLMYQWAPNDSRISCWINTTLVVNYYAETWDRGDSIGNPNGGESRFTGMSYKTGNDAWVNHNINSSTPCTLTGQQLQGGASTNTYCDLYAGNAMEVARP